MDNGFSKWSPSHTKAQLATWSLSKIVIFQRKALHPQSKQMFLKFNFQILNWNKNQVQTTFWKKKCIRPDLWFLICDKIERRIFKLPFSVMRLMRRMFQLARRRRRTSFVATWTTSWRSAAFLRRRSRISSMIMVFIGGGRSIFHSYGWPQAWRRTRHSRKKTKEMGLHNWWICCGQSLAK